MEGHPSAGEPICEENVILGCTDPSAQPYSYNALANCDDGSCEYAMPVAPTPWPATSWLERLRTTVLVSL